MGDPYAVLGVPRDATQAQIRAAYEQRLNAAAQRGDLAACKNLDAAHEVLRDPARRRAYDTTGTIDELPHIAYEGVAAPGRNWTLVDAPVSAAAVVPATSDAPRRRRHPVGATALTALLVVAAVFTLLRFAMPHSVNNLAHAAEGRFGGDYGATSVTGGLPTIRFTPHPKRLLPRVAPPPGADGYTLLEPDGSPPPHWDPCRPITYVISGAEPWPGANVMLRAAIADVSRATGLSFVNGGTTTEPPSNQRDSFQPIRYGNRWAPVLIEWTDEIAEPRLSGTVAGIGGPALAVITGQPRFVSGLVAFDGAQLAPMSRDGRTLPYVRVVLLHELGHLVGLGHYTAGPSVMAPRDGTVTELTDGDRRGLSAMGGGICFANG